MTGDDVIDTLRGAPADTDRLRERLAREAQREGLVDVLVRSVGSPIGGLLLATTPQGLAYVAFEGEPRDEVLAMLATKIGPRVVHAGGPGAPNGATGDADVARVLDDATAQIEAYLTGRRREFSLPLDTVLASGFRGLVQRRLPDVGYGHTATYREIATALDKPGAVRAVGTACATNPLPLVWPCHRILRSDGGLGGYRGGLEVKRRLLAMESAA
ncbi:methylated-DNA--[protein]-cysteine S-methyltransferase [Dietzia natronolimnaea]|uniref:methylated-DNA--[protein]-cysteine S-methyltransferase n=1 Tax=Dietzia natronolimnaea TaxID=161920 RepID=UPI0031F9610C